MRDSMLRSSSQPHCVRLVQVEIGAVVEADEQPVAVGAHRVVGCRDGRVVGTQPAAELGEGCRGRGSLGRQVERLTLRSELAEEPVGFAPDRTLRRARQRLAPRRELTVAGRVQEAGAQLVERRWHLGQPGPHAAPILLRFAWHVVEDVADVGVVAVQHAEPSVVLPGLDEIELRLHSLAHDFDGDSIAATTWLDARQFTDRSALQVESGRPTLGRVVGHLLVVSGYAPEGCEHRIERRALDDVLVRQLEDPGRAAAIRHGFVQRHPRPTMQRQHPLPW